MASSAKVDRAELETKVQDMYRAVALHPEGEFHFEMGRALAERLGYSPEDLDRIPPEAIESFAGVGYYFHLADLKEGESVLDLGSGSGMDTFVAALKVGPSGRVIGVDMTDEQRLKAERLRDRSGMRNVTYVKAYIESLDQSFGGQAQRVSGSGPRAQARRPSSARRHRHRGAAAGRNRLQLDAVGCLHRRGDATGRLPFGDRGSGLQDPNGRGESELSVHLR